MIFRKGYYPWENEEVFPFVTKDKTALDQPGVQAWRKRERWTGREKNRSFSIFNVRTPHLERERKKWFLRGV